MNSFDDCIIDIWGQIKYYINWCSESFNKFEPNDFHPYTTMSDDNVHDINDLLYNINYKSESETEDESEFITGNDDNFNDTMDKIQIKSPNCYIDTLSSIHNNSSDLDESFDKIDSDESIGENDIYE